MATLAQGQAVKLHCAISQEITVTPSTGGRATISANGPGNVSYAQKTISAAETFGPYLSDTDVVIAAVAGSLSYDLGTASMVDGAGNSVITLASLRQSDGYHFHGFAPNQISSDLKFYDYSGALNDAAFQAQLTAANAWATAGFLTQADPTGVGSLWMVRLPALSFDYLAGDSLLIFWRGMATPEGSDMPLMGDSPGTAANGIKVNVTSAGKLKVNAYQASGALSRFGGTSTATVFEAAIAHSFAVAIDGVTGKHCYWADGVRDAAFSGGFLTFGSGGIVDTTNSAFFNLGGDGSTSGSVQVGVACKTQSLAILKGRRGLGTPSITDLDLLVANLHRRPQALVTAEKW